MRTKLKLFVNRYGLYLLVVVCVVGLAIAAYATAGALLENTGANVTPDSEYDTGNEPSGKMFALPFSEHTTIPPEIVIPKPPIEPPADTPTEPPADEPPTDPAATEPEETRIEYVFPLAANTVPSRAYSGSTAVYDITLEEWRTHNGADLDAAVGSEVYAVYDGKVVFTGTDGLWGHTIKILLDTGVTAVYRLVTPKDGLSVGARVTAGDVVAYVAAAELYESADEPHLHFELHGANGYLDPMSIF